MKDLVVLVIVCIILLVQAMIMYRMSGSWLFPPALYGIYWSLLIFLSTTIHFGNYTLTLDSLLVFLLGGASFSAGGLFAVRCFSGGSLAKPTTVQRKEFIQMCIVIYSLGLLAMVPLFIVALRRAGQELGTLEFAVAARVALGKSDRMGIPHYFQSFTSVGAILAYCAAWLYDGTRRDKVILSLATLVPLAMSVLTFARTAVYMLIIGILGILTFRRTIRRRVVLMFLVITTALALVLGAMLGKGPEFGTGKNVIVAVVENLAVYFIGGPVGFAQVLNNPADVGEKGLSLRFFTQAMQSLGADIELPNNVLGYFSDLLGNVYTIYYAYWLDGGWWGVLLMALLAGFFCTAIYLMARRGNPMAGASMGIVVGSILNSATGDGLFGSSVPWLLILLIVGFLWRIPVIIWKSRSKECGNIAAPS